MNTEKEQNCQFEDNIIAPLLREWERLHRVQSDYRRIESMGAAEAAAHIPAVGEYIGKLETRLSNLSASIHAAHGLLVPLGSQITPDLLAIREATQILKSAGGATI